MNINRRSWLFLTASLLTADEREEITGWLGTLVRRLTQENASDFVKALDKTLRDRLERGIWAIVQNYEVSSSIAILGIAGDSSSRQIELDWFLALKPLAPTGQTVERRERVTMTLQPLKKGWQILSLSPESLFTPPPPG